MWYEITQEQTENEVFVRLNIGKIPLLPAENVKALFLAKNEDLKDDTLKERAEFWYEAEKKVRENRDFRYCVLSKIHRKDIQKNKTSDKPELKDDILRIEAYLKALSGRRDMFRYFYEYYKQKSINEEWDNLETCINILGSFASNTKQEKLDREIFHYLGFLIFNGKNLADIYQHLWLKEARKNKETFKEALFEKIKNKMSKSIANIEELNYLESEDRLNIKSLLLLFNLEYLNTQEKSNEYFKFNRFVLEEWSLEHIYAQNPKSIATAIKELDEEAIKKWLEEVLKYLDTDKDKTIKDKIKEILKSQTLQKEEIDNITKTLDDHFLRQTDLHAISNLTLLDKSSNSKIGNLIFSQKRLAIQKLAEEDRLIPIATKKGI
ncbi:DUF1524 domain-containing protein [Helicobacter sp. 14348-15]|uniref:DUF1524 domain-containing protein n=1 Tax=Helicobacter colisuis TaxID=2949739 RepID=UPI00202B2C70|nr:DUF1524 domain-containing protein [Helicobacter colisuis]MCL9821760.1 DUF1524 domain-containing protein [Helicobacter colisuis]